jgi:hypothetical protein
MDLVVNAVCKSAMRRRRVELILDYFENYKQQHIRANQLAQTLPKYAPPAPKLVDGIAQMLVLMSTTFATDQFRASLEKCFRSVGLCPERLSNGDPIWVQYNATHLGHIKSENIAPVDIPVEYSIAATLLDMHERPRDAEELMAENEDEDEDEDSDSAGEEEEIEEDYNSQNEHEDDVDYAVEVIIADDIDEIL